MGNIFDECYTIPKLWWVFVDFFTNMLVVGFLFAPGSMKRNIRKFLAKYLCCCRERLLQKDGVVYDFNNMWIREYEESYTKQSPLEIKWKVKDPAYLEFLKLKMSFLNFKEHAPEEEKRLMEFIEKDVSKYNPCSLVDEIRILYQVKAYEI